jgi:hypothetical protein
MTFGTTLVIILQLHVWVLLLVEFKFKILKIVAHAVRISDSLYR